MRKKKSYRRHQLDFGRTYVTDFARAKKGHEAKKLLLDKTN